jgi:hypothetical protein
VETRGETSAKTHRETEAKTQRETEAKTQKDRGQDTQKDRGQDTERQRPRHRKTEAKIQRDRAQDTESYRPHFKAGTLFRNYRVSSCLIFVLTRLEYVLVALVLLSYAKRVAEDIAVKAGTSGLKDSKGKQVRQDKN